MRRVLTLAIITAVALLMLGAALAFFARKPPGNDLVAIRDFRPVWTELKWPFPVDQWGIGKAFTCQAANCGSEVNLYVRAKIGFCNCTTGVADDDELDRVADVDLVGSGYAPLAPGRPIAVAWMKGRSRPYTIASATPSTKSALVVAFNDRCDVIVATAFVGDDQPAPWEPAIIEFLNGDVVLRWAEKTLGL
jgi:hypothetical protein